MIEEGRRRSALEERPGTPEMVTQSRGEQVAQSLTMPARKEAVRRLSLMERGPQELGFIYLRMRCKGLEAADTCTHMHMEARGL